MTRLMTATQVAEAFGLPKVRTVATMRSHGLPHVKLGKDFLYDPADVEAFIASRKESTPKRRAFAIRASRALPETGKSLQAVHDIADTLKKMGKGKRGHG